MRGLPMFAFRACAQALFPLALALFSAGQADAAWHQQQRDLMGTRISVELWHDDAAQAQRCSENAFAEMRRIETVMSTYLESSELSHINNNAAIAAVMNPLGWFVFCLRNMRFSFIFLDPSLPPAVLDQIGPEREPENNVR